MIDWQQSPKTKTQSATAGVRRNKKLPVQIIKAVLFTDCRKDETQTEKIHDYLLRTSSKLYNSNYHWNGFRPLVEDSE